MIQLSDVYRYIPDILGFVGAILVQVFYFLLTAGKCRATQTSFLLANFIGSFLMLISLYFNFNLGSFFIELNWLIITFYGLIKYTIFEKKML